MEVRIEEQRERQAVAPRSVACHPVRRAAVEAAGHAFEHVSEVADERARYRRSLQPTLWGAHLQAADGVLVEQREQAVVGVFADAPLHVEALRHWLARVIEQAEEDQRIAGIARGEVVGFQSQTEGDALHQPVADAGGCVQVLQQRLAQAGHLGEQVGAMQRRPGAHFGMLSVQFAAQVQAFLPVRAVGGQFAAKREIAAPGAPAKLHAPAQLARLVEGEELPRQALQALDQLRLDAVPDHVEEALLAAGAVDSHGDRPSRRRVAAGKGGDIDDRQTRSAHGVPHRGWAKGCGCRRGTSAHAGAAGG